jgi:hypothetical protein
MIYVTIYSSFSYKKEAAVAEIKSREDEPLPGITYSEIQVHLAKKIP